LKIQTGSAPEILYNTISSNQAVYAGTLEEYGGGIDIQAGSSPKVVGNLIEGNAVSAGCTFGVCGAGWGGGICVRSDSAVIVGNTIRNNSADGGYNRTCGGGGIAVLGCSPLISCNKITANLARQWGAIYISGGNPIIACNTISGNNAYLAVNAGGTFAYGGQGVFVLNNIHDNHDLVNSVFDVYSGTGSESLIMENNWWGTTNPSEIDLLVYDYWDDPGLREIDFIPFSTDSNTAPGDSIDVISPNGGETWYYEELHVIQWNPFCFTANVDIEYSIDGGATWEVIAQNTRNFGLYLWEVPFAASTTCKVRIFDGADSIPSDMSDTNFTICPGPTILVDYPNGEEVLSADSTYGITWNSYCFDSSVKIDYSTNGGTDWTTIVADTANIGSIAWTTPHATSPNCRVKVSDAQDGNPSDASDDDFSIYICGDANGNGQGPNVADLTYLVDYLFRSGPPPPVMSAANVNGQGGINVADLTYLVDYLFRSGPKPVCGQ
jgi:hypothetical protein